MKIDFLSRLTLKGLFNGEIWKKSNDTLNKKVLEKDANIVFTEITQKCTQVHINGVIFNIPKKDSNLSDTEVEILYNHWKQELRKTKLHKLFESNSIEFFNISSNEKESIFNQLDINSLQIKDSNMGESSNYVNTNSTSGIVIKHTMPDQIYNEDAPEAETEIHINHTQVYSGCTSNRRVIIRNFIPGPWIDSLANDLEKTQKNAQLVSPTSSDYRVTNAIELNKSQLQYELNLNEYESEPRHKIY